MRGGRDEVGRWALVAVNMLLLLFGFVSLYELHMKHSHLRHAYTHGKAVC